MPIEELIRTLKVHEQELQQDKGIKKGKSLALTTQKNKTSLVSKEPTSRPTSKNSSKAISTNLSSNDEGSNEDDQLPFILRKIRNMWKKKNGSNLRGSTKK